jgi:fucose 4-O-acetylase-like acetyltransferase
MKRDSRLDVARGIAIIAIVLVHVVKGLTASGLLNVSFTDVAYRSVGLWCLTVFAFVGGALVPGSVRKAGVSHYVRDRVIRFVFIYLVWSVLQGTMHLIVVAGGEANRSTSIGEQFELWRPDGQLWYLPFLILVTVVFVPLQPWLPKRAPWLVAIAAVPSVIWWGYDGGVIGAQGRGLVVFFVAGMAVGAARVQVALDRFARRQAAVISVAVLVVAAVLCVRTTAIIPTFYWFQGTPARIAIGVVLAVVTLPAVLLFAHAVRSASFLALCGRRSLDIYLAHMILISGTRIILLRLGVHQVWLIALVSIPIGVLGSWALGTIARRVGLGWVFDGPNWLASLGRKPIQPDQQTG